MTYEELNKDEKIKWTVEHLAKKFGEDSFNIKDHWDTDLCAIGLTDKDEKHLIYISVIDPDGYYIALENSIAVDDFPYEPAEDFDNVSLEELEKIFAQHLRL